MEKVTEIVLLLDFYGQLLTPRQYEILDLHYNSDFSLAEIASQLNISRQGVHDGVKKGKDALKRLEEKLGLVKRFSRQEEILRKVLISLQNIQPQTLKSQEHEIISLCIQELETVMTEL